MQWPSSNNFVLYDEMAQLEPSTSTLSSRPLHSGHHFVWSTRVSVSLVQAKEGPLDRFIARGSLAWQVDPHPIVNFFQYSCICLPRLSIQTPLLSHLKRKRCTYIKSAKRRIAALLHEWAQKPAFLSCGAVDIHGRFCFLKPITWTNSYTNAMFKNMEWFRLNSAIRSVNFCQAERNSRLDDSFEQSR